MTNSNNEQDLVFKARFEDDASEDIQSLDGDVESLDSSMGGLSMSAVGAGLALFGVGVGVQQVVQGAVESHKRMTATRALIKLLPEAAKEALSELQPFYEDIGKTVGATNLEVEETAVAITNATGGIAPSIDQLQFVYDLMATTGAGAAEAGDAVAESIRGNQKPLQDLLGDKYNFRNLEEAMALLAGTAEESKTPMDDITRILRNWNEELATSEGQESLLRNILPPVSAILDSINLWDDYWDAVHNDEEINNPWDYITNPGGDAPIGSSGQVHDPLEQQLIDQGVYGVGAAGMGSFATGNQPVSVGITINGDIDSAQRASVIMRQVELQIRNIYRGGINTIVDTRMFPS
jgi:hypothetical protein